MSAQSIRDKVARVPKWRHRIDLGNGVMTPGREECEIELSRIGLPQNLTGVRVLDVGCSDGFYSFEAERRGASEVFGIDNFTTTAFNKGLHGFLVAARILGSNAKLIPMNVYDISQEELGEFDLVLFLNVLYHLKHPLYALERISSLLRPGGTMLLKSYFHQDVRVKGWGFDFSTLPFMRFFSAEQLNNDPTNWWAPNRRCLRQMLEVSGFPEVEELGTWGDRIYCRCIRGDRPV